MNRWDYVMSGVSHATFKRELFNDEKLLEKIRHAMTSMNRLYSNQKACILFNGFQERTLGKLLNHIFQDTTEYYVDSGGLQMVTLGVDISDERKKEIYQTQGELGNFAMSFDEIPLRLLSDRSTFHDTSSRLFDVDRFEECARKSGQNLREQIEFFKDMGTTAKPFLIIQGNDMDYYQQWTDMVLEEVGPENWEYIGGLSVGAAALGQGEFEDYQRAFFATNLQAPQHIKDHIHLLGVGSVKRLAPMIALRHAGHFDGAVISYDSTTHTSGLSIAQFQLGRRITTFRNGKLGEWNVVEENILNFAQNTLGIELDRDILQSSYLDNRGTWHSKFGTEREFEFQLAKFCSLFASIANFMGALDKADQDINNLYEVVGHKTFGKTLAFSKVRDLHDFNEWCSYNRNALKSKGVVSSKGFSSLEDLFDD